MHLASGRRGVSADFGSSGVISSSPSPEEASMFRHGWLHTRYYLRDPDHILTFSFGRSGVTHFNVIARGLQVFDEDGKLGRVRHGHS